MDILIVDDNAVQRKILRSQLARLGYDVREATDGVDAWTQLQREPSPIVITDWMMPGLDGPELIVRIRARRQGPSPWGTPPSGRSTLTAALGRSALPSVEGRRASGRATSPSFDLGTQPNRKDIFP